MELLVTVWNHFSFFNNINYYIHIFIIFIECDDTCVGNCTGNPLNCDECIENYIKVGNICQKCAETEYKSGNSCLPCPHPFLKCSDENTLISCKVGTGRLGPSNQCKCDSGYFNQGTKANCGKCQFPCLTCTERADNCTSNKIIFTFFSYNFINFYVFN